MERRHFPLFAIGGVVLVAGLGLGARAASKYASARQVAEEENSKEVTCGEYLDKKLTILVKTVSMSIVSKAAKPRRRRWWTRSSGRGVRRSRI